MDWMDNQYITNSYVINSCEWKLTVKLIMVVNIMLIVEIVDIYGLLMLGE